MIGALLGLAQFAPAMVGAGRKGTMDLIGDLLGTLGNAASGGLFGLVGSLIGAGAKFVQERQRQSWEMKKWAHEESLLRLEMERGAQETEQELLITSEKAAADIKARSYDMGMVSGPVHTWVNDVRALFRPWLTVFLWVIVGVIMWLLIGGGLSGIIDAQDAIALIDYTVRSAVFAASAATVWWFGDRAMQPPHRSAATN